ncbi:hypothetical protein KW786_00075 [Candidatus Parcubacteria bacterium]|nr:hypothetical protein [Candidatus Parcubacteria bacterium]
MHYPRTISEISQRIIEYDENALRQMEKADRTLFSQGIFRPDQFPAYLLWMMGEAEGFSDREKAARWHGWVFGKVDGIPSLELIALGRIRDLVRADKKTADPPPWNAFTPAGG